MEAVDIGDALAAADEIYNTALQIMSAHEVDAKMVPLIIGCVAHRLEPFALGAMAHELSALEAELEQARKEHEDSEVENG